MCSSNRSDDAWKTYPHESPPGTHRCAAPPREPHPCPFSQEIHDDNETLCDCCEACTQECQGDI